ncbi:ROK family transcriptional regulator [Romeria aff. gracilis LEGE 07310]|uniref:ROK family transcriptional regulator n=1 Tax=Vasconcelosia minhoensis LEGE 07310 TaxID=915328 RepID=A0A8J7B0U0_9CYAN|nr:ROK family transcriptional regulator [Romeria gracilis]MBE9080217.1 ROK family transcriptional regulator [Romeria aff. gracilis LEGE 07310]
MKTNSVRTLNTDSSLLKQINYVRILGLLRCNAGLSRAEIARRTGLTRSTVTVITAELLADGLIRQGAAMASQPGGGRPGMELDLNPDGAFFIGAAIEADHIKVAELNLAAEMKAKLSMPLTDTDPDTVISQLVQLIQQLRRANPFSSQRLRGIGLTTPGTINRDGVLIRVPGLNWHGVNLRKYLEAHVTLPLFIDNDANSAALAEVYLGSAVQSDSLLFLLLNEGVGSGIVINHRIMRGANGTAGEVCELMIDDQNLIGSEYGQPGSFGALVGKAGLLKQYQQQVGKMAELSDLIEALNNEDKDAYNLVSQWAGRLGQGLANIINIINPERIILGGSLTALLPYIEDQLSQILTSELLGNGEFGFFSTPNSRWNISEFGEDASVIGGAVLVYQSLFQIPDLVLLNL